MNSKLLYMSIYLFPILVSIYYYDYFLLNPTWHNIWFIYFIPTILLTYYHGMKGAILNSLTCGTALLIGFLYAKLFRGHTYQLDNLGPEAIQAIFLLTGIVAVSLTFGFVTEKLRKKHLELEKANSLLEEMINYDTLTGLQNHHCFQRCIDKYFSADNNSYESLTYVLVDITDFRLYNKAMGYEKGDMVLVSVAAYLTSLLEEGEEIARYGPDVFVLLLKSRNGEKLQEFMDKIQNRALADYLYEIEGFPEGKLKLAVGWANYPSEATSKDSVMQLAENRLYLNKENQRSSVAVYYNVVTDLQLESQSRGLDSSVSESLKVLLSLINSRDRYTYAHSERVSYYVKGMCESLQLSPEEKHQLQLAAFFHDLGKVEIPRSILGKPGKLTQEEYEIIKQHPYYSGEILRPLNSFHLMLPSVIHHHERYDGQGYPQGLKGQEIPLGARILAVADSFDAMTTSRAYRGSMTIEAAVAELDKCAGSQFDPDLVQLFKKMLSRQQQYIQEELLTPNPISI